MRAFIVPAKYTPEITTAIQSAVRQIEHDMKQQDLGATEHYVDVDESLAGNLVVIIGESGTKPEIVRWGHQTQPTGSAA